MPVKIRPYPTLKGKDAERFIERQKENERLLKEKAEKLAKKWNEQRNK